ncbi:MAG: hypothetical protein LUH05_05860 [Candidatus Gastranaerophilales bacterium]|nr:hypothetical protein [Candidatus Gastranaerophilales bacterium]
MTKFNKRFSIYTISLVIVFAIGIILRILTFINRCYFVPIDECHSLYEIGSSSYITVLTTFVEGANFLPFCRLILKFIHQIFGFNYVILKLPALLAGICSLFVFYKVLDKLFKNKILIISALIIFSFSYNLINYSAMIKFYMFDVLIALLILYYTLTIKDKYKEETIPLKTLFISCLVSVLFIFTSFNAIVIIEIYWFLLFLKYFFNKNIPNVIRLIIYQAVAGIFIIIEYLTYINQMSGDESLKNQWLTNGFFFRPDTFDAINSLIHFSYFCFYWYDNELSYRLPDFVILLFLLIFIAGIIRFTIPAFKKHMGDGLFVISPVLFFLLLSFLYIYPFCNRIIVFLIPFFIIIIFKALDFNDLNNKLKYLTSFLSLTALSLFFFYVKQIGELKPLIIEDYSKPTKQIINMFEDIKKDDELILSYDVVCADCMNSKNIIFINRWESIITPSNISLHITDKKTRNQNLINSLKDVLKGKNKVIFAYSVIDDEENAIPVIKQLIEEEGYKLIKEETNTTFAEYSLYILEKN